MYETEARIEITFINYDEDVSKVLDCLNYKVENVALKGELRKTGKLEKPGRYGKHDRYFSQYTLRQKSRFTIGEELFKICEELLKIEDKLKRVNNNGSIWITTIQYPPDFLPTNLDPSLIKLLGKLEIGLSLENWA